MSASQQIQASGRAKQRLIMKHRDEYNKLYQEELNKVGIKTREQQLEERYTSE